MKKNNPEVAVDKDFGNRPFEFDGNDALSF